MNRRRGLLAGLGAALGLVRPARAQPATRLPRIGVLSPAGADILDRADSSVANFMLGLRELGYVDARNVVIDRRVADPALDRLPALAVQLVQLQPDVIFTHGAAGAMAAARATTTIAIVVGPAGEEALAALAGNLARPTGNVTGLALSSVPRDQKCLQMLKEIAPRTRKVAIVVNPDEPAFSGYEQRLAQGLGGLSLELVRIEARRAADVPAAFKAIAASGAGAGFLSNDVVLAGTPQVRARFIEAAARQRLPIVSSQYALAADGGLLSLYTDLGAMGRRAAQQVHRILGGARPGDLPVELPTIHRLAINLKVARALGLAVPHPLLLRADEVIE